MVEPAESLNASRHKLFDEVDFCDYLWILETTDDINYDALQVVRVYEQLLRRNVVAFPKEIYFFTDLTCAAIVDPFEFAEW